MQIKTISAQKFPFPIEIKYKCKSVHEMNDKVQRKLSFFLFSLSGSFESLILSVTSPASLKINRKNYVTCSLGKQ